MQVSILYKNQIGILSFKMYFTRQGYAMNGLINLKYLSSNFEKFFFWYEYKSFYINCKIPVKFTFLYKCTMLLSFSKWCIFLYRFIDDEFGLKLDSDIQTNEYPYRTHWSWHLRIRKDLKLKNYKTVLFTISVDLEH